MKKLESIILTGASGFIGSYLIEMMREYFIIYAIARRAINETNISYHSNLHWIQCDITNRSSLKTTMDYIKNQGGADYIIHLAAYYDFTYKDNPEYDSVNVNGTKNLLDFAKVLGIKRFIFASSIAACNFPNKGEFVTEKSALDANYHYARSKKIGEKLLMQYSEYFPCTVIRFAAVFSDWCEFAPLYKFLQRWLTKSFDSRIVGGAGKSAVPYIHIRDICRIICKIINKNNELPKFDIYICSPNYSTSHNTIFELSTRYFFGKQKKPLYLPKILAYPALLVNNLMNFFRRSSEATFEKAWMIEYIDKALDIDSSYTQKILGWKPTSRYHIERRLLFLLEKMKAHSREWHLRNEAVVERISKRANFMIYEKMVEEMDLILNKINKIILLENPNQKFNHYKIMPIDDFQAYLSTLYHLLLATIRSSDRSFFLEYIDKISIRRFAEGFVPETLCETLKVFSEIIIKQLYSIKELSKIKQEIYDNVSLTLQIVQDEIEDLYDTLVLKMPEDTFLKATLPDCQELQRKIRQLSAFYQVSPKDSETFDIHSFNGLREF